MEIIRRISDQQYELPVYSTGDLNDDALLMPGVTAETDLGALILATGTSIANVFGTIPGGFDVSEKGTTTVTTGLTWPTATIKPSFEAMLHRAELDQSDTMALTGDEAANVITVAGSADNRDTGFVYCVSGTGIGQFRYVGAAATNTLTFAVAGDPEWKTGDTCIYIPKLFDQKLKLNTTADKLGTDPNPSGASGELSETCVIQTWIERNARKELLYPPAHRSLNGLNTSNISVRFFVDFLIRNTSAHRI